MANKLLESLKNTKARSLLVFGLFIFLVIGVVVYFATGKSTPLGTEQSKAGTVPQITAIPGGTTSERYQELQEAENKRRAEDAKKKGISEVATIIGSRSKDALASKERFGIEDLMKGKECNCPGGVEGEIDPARAAALMAEIEADPSKALDLLRANPGLAKAMCNQKPDLSLKVMEKDPEVAKIILNACPKMAQALAEKNPVMFKKLMLENPELAKKLAADNPALFKKLISEDPTFAKALTQANPELVKTLLKNDPDFADKFGKQHPDLIKNLMLNDPEFAKTIAKNNPELVTQLMKDDPSFARSLRAQNPGIDAIIQEAIQAKTGVPVMSAQDRAKALAEQERKLREAKLQQSKLTELQQKQVTAIMGAMEGQAKSVYQAWNEFNAQQFVQGEWATKEDEEKNGKCKTGNGSSGSKDGKTVVVAGEGGAMIKAGTVIFAVLDTTVSSDEPGPILATVVEGKYRGSRLVGTFTAAPQPGGLPPEKVILNFSTMNIPAAPASISISAVAIDPDTARTALATDVDNHFLLRYGSILASSFLVGYSKVITAAGSVQTTSANGLATTTTAAQLSGRKEILAALGEVGKKLGESWKGYANIPPTIIVESGTGIGILFLSDVAAG